MIWIKRFCKYKILHPKSTDEGFILLFIKLQFDNLIIKSQIWIIKRLRYILLKRRGPVSYNHVFRNNFRLLHYSLSKLMYVFERF